MAWAIITIYTSKCAQMYPQQLPKTSKLYSRCKKCDIEKTLWDGYHPPLVTRRLHVSSCSGSICESVIFPMRFCAYIKKCIASSSNNIFYIRIHHFTQQTMLNQTVYYTIR